MSVNSTHVEQLRQLDACVGAIEFAAKFDTLDEAWQACERGDWMGWLCGKMAGPPMSDSRRPLALAATECARLVLHLNDDPRVLACIETVERFGNGEDVSRFDMITAANAAAVAAYVAAYAAHAAAYAAHAAANADATDAAYAAADAAATAVAVAANADAADAVGGGATIRSEIRRQCADIWRKHYPHAPAMMAKADCLNCDGSG